MSVSTKRIALCLADESTPLDEIAEAAVDHRPVIEVRPGDASAIDELESAIAASGQVFQRARVLVKVGAVHPRARGGIRRAPGAPVITVMSIAAAFEDASRAARFQKPIGKSGVPRDCHPMREHLAALLARDGYAEIPELVAVVEAPTIRPNGSLLETPGYDTETGILLRADAAFCAEVAALVPEHPTLDDAHSAAAMLSVIFQDFPFVSDADRAVMLALILTLVSRYAIDGDMPGFGLTSPVAGSGKSLAVDAATVVATGRRAPRFIETTSDEEMRKRLFTIGLAGDLLVLLDNLSHPLKSDALSAAMTSCTIEDRLLGLNRTIKAPFDAVVALTGNNLSIRGDGRRRFTVSRMDPKCERPDQRSGFRLNPLLDCLMRDRAHYVAAALTILRAHAEAGRPISAQPFGSFEPWSDVVRGALIWATDVDPCETRERLYSEDNDPEEAALARLFKALHGVHGDQSFTAKGTLNTDANGASDSDLDDALVEMFGSLDAATPKSLGTRLRGARDKVLWGLRLTQKGTDRNGVARWQVVPC